MYYLVRFFLSIVVPCFNEEVAIPLFIDQINGIIKNILGETEFIFVDDGSTDNTLLVLQRLIVQDARIHYVSFSRNFGKEAAMLAGLKAARGEYVAIMDADGQDPPALIPEMLKAVTGGGMIVRAPAG